MFSDNIQIIKNSFINYFGTKSYFSLFISVLLCIFLLEKDKKKRAFLIYFSVLELLVVLNPIFNKCVDKLLNKNVYWRTFWIIPLGITMAYAGVLIIKNISEKSKKIIAMCFIILIILLNGRCVYFGEAYSRVNNLYKIPDECLQIINTIGEINIDNKKIMISPKIIEYVRQIDANIKIAYQRRPYGDYACYEIVTEYTEGDVENLINLCNKNQVNIIVYDNSITLSSSPEFYGFKLYAQTENYDIYVLQ